MKDQLTLQIEGMHCGNCVAKVAKSLTSLDGVEIDSLAIGKAVVNVRTPDTTAEDLIGAVRRAGYNATLAG